MGTETNAIFSVMIKCNICNEILTISEYQEHVLTHIPPVNVLDLFDSVGDQFLDEKFPQEEVQKIVDDLYWYDDFEDFNNFRNSDEWISDIMELSWKVIEEWFKEIDEELVGEDLTIDYAKIRNALSRIVHRYVTDITKQSLSTAVNCILNQLDAWRENRSYSTLP